MDCGPASLKMVCKYHGREVSIAMLRDLCQIGKDGATLLGLHEASKQIGFDSNALRLSANELLNSKLPCILYWGSTHFVVLYGYRNERFTIADPNTGIMHLTHIEFERFWHNDGSENKGIALLMTPTRDFFTQSEKEPSLSLYPVFLIYIKAYKKTISQVIIGLLLASVFQFVIPFLKQASIDWGVLDSNYNIVYLLVLAQAALIVGRVVTDYIRNWILLNISNRTNVTILKSFVTKLTKLPIKFFDSKLSGDILQRLNDQQRIESFLTGQGVSSIFSILNLLIFSVVLAIYNLKIWIIFVLGTTVYVLWVKSFMRHRRALNYKAFGIGTKSQDNVIQMISGMQEIKLNNCEKQKITEWEEIQADLFEFQLSNTNLTQKQNGGSILISELTNILVSLFSALAVISGELTLGGMLAVQYIIGNLTSPVQNLLSVTQSYQDALISFERLKEIHELPNEIKADVIYYTKLPDQKYIDFVDVTFNYRSLSFAPTLSNFSVHIPEGKTTAIVGMSGAGKTTFLKLLLRFYEIDQGQILIGGIPLNTIDFKVWRDSCGTVMQDGFLFSDTIEKNITLSTLATDEIKLKSAIESSNVLEFTKDLPLGLQTKIGANGQTLSRGQMQRLLIARAIYKDAPYLFFDEATNSLDADNEKTITDNLESLFKDRTVITIAHRLSTVKNADQILVFDEGRVIEHGSHENLLQIKGKYYHLVKNQLENA